MNQLEMISKLFKERGIEGFFNGLSAKLSQTVINSALMLVIYEKLHRIISLVVAYMLKKRG